MQLNYEYKPINEFVTANDFLDEPPLATDLTLRDNALAIISSRTSNNAYMPRTNLLARSSNFYQLKLLVIAIC